MTEIQQKSHLEKNNKQILRALHFNQNPTILKCFTSCFVTRVIIYWFVKAELKPSMTDVDT